MKKGSKEMLRTILSNQELIMKALKVEVPAKKVVAPKASKPAKSTAKKSPPKKSTKTVGKPAVKSVSK